MKLVQQNIKNKQSSKTSKTISFYKHILISLVMAFYKLNKTVLLFKNAEKLLTGITTNTFDASKNAFVDKFGKIVATAEQIRENENEILLVVSSHCLQSLYSHLKPYLSLTKAEIKALPYLVYYEDTTEYIPIENEFVILQDTGQIIITNKKLRTESDEAFTQFRVQNNIPLHSIDYTNEMLLNVSEEYVSWTKGCFLGQEILARVHHLGKPPLKLIVISENEISPEQQKKMTSVIIDNGKKKGFLFVRN